MIGRTLGRSASERFFDYENSEFIRSAREKRIEKELEKMRRAELRKRANEPQKRYLDKRVPLDKSEFWKMMDKGSELILMVYGPAEQKIGFRHELGEVISRKENLCNYYRLGNISSILDLEGQRFDLREQTGYRTYIMTIDRILEPSRKMPVLGGFAQKYHISNNLVEEGATSLNVKVGYLRKFKEKAFIAYLCGK